MTEPSMPSLKHTLIQCRYLFGACLLFIILAFTASLLYSKATIFWALTPWHSSIGNYFFWGVTQLGNGIFAILIAVFLLIKKQYRAAAVVLLTYALSGIAAQAIKHLVAEPRPFLYFKEMGIAVPVVEGETVYGHSSSFPSGHTASIFSLVTSLAMLFASWRKQWGWLFFVAVLVAYSRMYVSNHFLVDLAGGALLGMLASILAYRIVYWFEGRRLVRLDKK